jgi:hypothetical protein
MKDIIRRICELQPSYVSENSPAMAERGQLVRHSLASAVEALESDLSPALGRFGADFIVEAKDGMGRKTELPWIRFCSASMSPRPTDGYYVVLHFSTDGSAVNVTIGCGSSQYENGSFRILEGEDLDRKTGWARQVVLEEFGTIEPFVDPPDFGARRPLPKSFERATALCKRVEVSELDETDIEELLVQAATYLNAIYRAETDGRDLSPADQDERQICGALRPGGQGGQGFGLSAEDRRLVEGRAMELADRWLRDAGFETVDRSASHAYDIEATRGNELLKVEVKGTTSDRVDAISMTRNEVQLHREEAGATALFIVSRIRLRGAGESRFAEGGEVEPLISWNIEDWVATPIAFRVARNRS